MHPHIHYMTNIDLFKGAIVREVFLYINGQGFDLNKKADGMGWHVLQVLSRW